MRIEFFIPGLAKPGGSKRAFALRRGGKVVTRPGGAPVIIVTDDAGKPGKDWRQTVQTVGREAIRIPPLRVALSVSWRFVRPRPKGHYRTGRHAGELHDWALDEWPTTKPDATKLVRAAEDALTGIAWADDAQIVHQTAVKVYGERPGLLVSIDTEIPGVPTMMTGRCLDALFEPAAPAEAKP